MNDMAAAIVPKSDQLNADDLISGPISITITGTSVRPGTEQPVAIAFSGDNGKPWKPCKSMSRVLVTAWGPDSSKYVGKSLTLYRDPKVTWGGMEVGGIRISHMSDIGQPLTMALTAAKQSRRPYTVKPLTVDRKSSLDAPKAKLDDPQATSYGDEIEALISAGTDSEALGQAYNKAAKTPAYAAFRDADPERAKSLRDKALAKIAELKGPKP